MNLPFNLEADRVDLLNVFFYRAVMLCERAGKMMRAITFGHEVKVRGLAGLDSSQERISSGRCYGTGREAIPSVGIVGCVFP